MTNFYEVAEKVSAKHDRALIGAVVLYEVLRNRIDHRSVYHRGNVRDYRNKEASRLHKAMSSLAEQDEPDTIDTILENLEEPVFARKIDSYRDVFEINFVYDAVRYMVQNYVVPKEGEKRTERLTQVSKTLGDCFVNAFLSRPSRNLDQYTRERRTITAEYRDFLKTLRNRIQSEFHQSLPVTR